MLAHRDHLGADGLADKRAQQQLEFTWALVRDELDQRLRHSAGVRRIRDEVRDAVLAGELPAPAAADRLLAAYDELSPRWVKSGPAPRLSRQVGTAHPLSPGHPA